MSPTASPGGVRPSPRAQVVHRFNEMVALAGALDPLYRRGYLDGDLGIPPSLEISPDYMQGYHDGGARPPSCNRLQDLL